MQNEQGHFLEVYLDPKAMDDTLSNDDYSSDNLAALRGQSSEID